MSKILVKLHYPNACPPSKPRPEDAGWDLYSYRDLSLQPGTTAKLDCGVAIWVPNNFVGLIFPRSSWRARGLVCHSVYDHGYTGLCQPFVTNASRLTLQITEGERVLQFLFLPAQLGDQIQVVEELPSSSRGTLGAGSSGRF